MTFYFLFFSSSNFGGGGRDCTLNFTPSLSGFSKFEINFISKKKFMFEQFLNGIFMMFFEGIFIILNPVFWFTIYLRQMMPGTSPRLDIGIECTGSSFTCKIRAPLISVEASSSGILALIWICMGSSSLIGTYISVTSSPPSTNLNVKTSP